MTRAPSCLGIATRLLPILVGLLSLLIPSESTAFVRRDVPPGASFGIGPTHADEGGGNRVLLSKTRSDGSFTAAYRYDSVGAMVAAHVNGRAGEVLRAKPSVPMAPVVGDVYPVGASQTYTSIEAAVAAIYVARGTNTFVSPAVVLVKDTNYPAPVSISADLGALHPTEANPLDIMGDGGKEIVIGGTFAASDIGHVRLVSLRCTGGMTFTNVEGAALASCVIEASVLFTNCPSAKLIGNTFNCVGGHTVALNGCPGALVRNNILLNTSAGVAWLAHRPDSAFNCYYPSNAVVETNSIYVDPLLDSRYMLASNSPAIGAGSTVSGYLTAYQGKLRDGLYSCMGADEYFDDSLTNYYKSYGKLANAGGGPLFVAPVVGAVYPVGPTRSNATVEAALAAIFAERGSSPFTNAAIVMLDAGVYAADIAVTNALLAPTADYPLVIRSRPENRVELTGAIRVEGPDHVRLQGLFLDPAAGKTVRLVSTSGSGLGACVAKATVTATNCTDLKIVGNTFDYRTGGARLEILGGSGSLLRNNVILNDGTTNGLYVSGISPNSDYNCYYPSNTPAEAHSVYSDPMLSPTDYTVTNLASPVVSAGQAVSGFDVDVGGYSRDPATPCIGAAEVLFDDIGEAPDSRGADGRLARRRVGRWVIDYAHDGLGRLTACSACDGTVTNTGSYAYDPFTRRIGMTLVRDGVTNVYRFVYDGPDVVAEFVDVDGDGVADRKRVYWLTEEIDQRIGFADITAGGVSFYYYLVDQVGTVQQIVDESGTVVNQYEYDAWGNVHWNSSNTIERVENRYLFQGREWDPIGMHYSFRFRSMLPDQHIFDGSDRNLAAGILRETEGYGSLVVCRNDPVNNWDPTGTDSVSASLPGGGYVQYTTSDYWLTYNLSAWEAPPPPPAPYQPPVLRAATPSHAESIPVAVLSADHSGLDFMAHQATLGQYELGSRIAENMATLPIEIPAAIMCPELGYVDLAANLHTLADRDAPIDMKALALVGVILHKSPGRSGSSVNAAFDARGRFHDLQTGRFVSAQNASIYGVSFFDRKIAQDILANPKLGRAGQPHFFMPLEDATGIRNAGQAFRQSGGAPGTLRAYLADDAVFGLVFPAKGSTVRVPTALDAGGWKHYLEGGRTALRTTDEAGYLLNSTREYVVPGGGAMPKGAVLFELGPSGEWTIVRRW